MCKKELQKQMGLPSNPDTPLLGFIGRLDHQKGPDILLDAVQELAERDCQVSRVSSILKECQAAIRDFS